MNVYQELGETSRRQILSELRTGHKSVTDLVKATGLKQPNVSNHLARLKDRGIVRNSKVGRQVFYSLASPEVEVIVNSALSNLDPTDEILDFESLAKMYAKAGVAGDEQTCGEIMDRAYRARIPLIDIYQEILSPAMTLIGTWYKVEAIDEAQEHLASSITERMMARTIQLSGPSGRQARTALLGCAANSWHVIGLRMLADFLRLSGWRTLFLGANVPTPSFAAAVKQHRPQLVLVSCSADEALEESVQLVRALNELRAQKLNFALGVGGHSVQHYPERFTEAGADFSSPDLRSFATSILPMIESGGRAALDESEVISRGA
ncbi:MAG: metalloregulator ArsR/SmtB family transcription factor [Fimbriimonas sp.]